MEASRYQNSMVTDIGTQKSFSKWLINDAKKTAEIHSIHTILEITIKKETLEF